MGFSFAFPFLPLYLQDLGVRRPSELAFWTGVVSGASGLALAVMSPLWGAFADRYGRRSMLIRAMVGGAVTVGLMGFARGPVDLLVLRILQGATSGTVAAATALVASSTPRQRVGWALGVLTSSIAVGSALGPSLGGIAAGAFGFRAIFWAGGAMLLAASLPVAAVVREAPLARGGSAAEPALRVLREATPGTIAAVAALVVCQCLLQTAYSGFQPLVVLRLLQVVSSGAATLTGIAFGISGLATAAAAVLYSGLARRLGYRRVAIAASLLLGAFQMLAGFGPGVSAIVLGATLAGAFYGTVGPAVTSMVGLETPARVQARVFGVSSSATALGFALGPLGGGLVASQLGPPPAIAVMAIGAALLALVLALRTREPAR